MISQQLGEILKRELWLAFRDTGKDLNEEIRRTAVNRYMVSNKGKPVSILSIVTGRHSSALLNAPMTDTLADEEITVKSVVDGEQGKALANHQRGFSFPVTNPKQWKAIFANIKRRGYYDSKHNGRNDGKVVIQARPFIQPAIRDVLKDSANIFRKRISEHFNGRLFEGKVIVVE